MINKKIGLIGSGNMGEAFIGAVINSKLLNPSDIFTSDIDQKRLDKLNTTYKINTMQDNFKVFCNSDIVILAVKPQIMESVLIQITENKDYKTLKTRKLIVSIAAGIKSSKIENILYPPLGSAKNLLPIIRVMPNTPSLVLSGMSGMSCNKHVSSDESIIAKKILSAMGNVIEFKEEDLDAVTAISGSGPAYVFFLAESMKDAGVKLGLNEKDAFLLSLKTLKGAVKLMEEKDEPPEVLREKVTSPGGTTEAAFNFFSKNQIKEKIIQGISAAWQRSKELSS